MTMLYWIVTLTLSTWIFMFVLLWKTNLLDEDEKK